MLFQGGDEGHQVRQYADIVIFPDSEIEQVKQRYYF